MLGKSAVFLLLSLLGSSCSQQVKYYQDFSFFESKGVILDSSFLEIGSRKTIIHPDSTWTWVGQLSTTFDIGYKLYLGSDSLFIFYGNDTILLNTMLDKDSIYLPWFTLENFYNPAVYRL